MVASPPQAENGGLPDARVLAACALLGVDEVYAVGGAQAIAMLGYGSDGADEADRCEPVDVITGPGNIWVTAAKRLLRGVVGIDAEAGPTEIAILADDTADPVHVAADLISQAEHDPLAASVLVTDSPALADAVEAELARQVPATKHEARVATALTGAAVRRGAGRRPRAGPAGGRRVRGRAPGDPDPRRARPGRCGSATPARSSSAPGRRCRSATTRPGPTTCCPPAAAPGTPSGLSVQTFLRGIHVVEYDEARCATSPPTWSRWPTPRTCRRTAQAVTRPVRRDDRRIDGPADPRRPARARRRTARRSSTSRCG